MMATVSVPGGWLALKSQLALHCCRSHYDSRPRLNLIFIETRALRVPSRVLRCAQGGWAPSPEEDASPPQQQPLFSRRAPVYLMPLLPSVHPHIRGIPPSSHKFSSHWGRPISHIHSQLSPLAAHFPTRYLTLPSHDMLSIRFARLLSSSHPSISTVFP
jgi:hypothetical protein